MWEDLGPVISWPKSMSGCPFLGWIACSQHVPFPLVVLISFTTFSAIIRVIVERGYGAREAVTRSVQAA